MHYGSILPQFYLCVADFTVSLPSELNHTQFPELHSCRLVLAGSRGAAEHANEIAPNGPRVSQLCLPHSAFIFIVPRILACHRNAL